MFGSLCCCNLERGSKVRDHTITKKLIRPTACTNMSVCTPPKINYKYVYSSTSVGFSGPSAVSPPESLAASLSQARGFIPSTTCLHSYQHLRLKVHLSTSDGLNLWYHPLHKRPNIWRIHLPLVSFCSFSFLWLPLVFPPVQLPSDC